MPSLFWDGLFLVMNLLCGFPESNKLPRHLVPVIVSHEPGGTSIKNIIHWIQFFTKQNFSMFDHGKKINLLRYGTENPPAYPVEKLKLFKTPKHFFIGTKDIIGNYNDTEKLYNLFDKNTTNLEILDDYAHLCYVWSTEAYLTLYPKILQIIT